MQADGLLTLHSVIDKDVRDADTMIAVAERQQNVQTRDEYMTKKKRLLLELNIVTAIISYISPDDN